MDGGDQRRAVNETDVGAGTALEPSGGRQITHNRLLCDRGGRPASRRFSAPLVDHPVQLGAGKGERDEP